MICEILKFKFSSGTSIWCIKDERIWSNNVFGSGASGGCFITKPARSGKACKCSYVAPLVFPCKGSVVNCKDSNDNKCKQPDTSFQACQQGSGDCEGDDEFSKFLFSKKVM